MSFYGGASCCVFDSTTKLNSMSTTGYNSCQGAFGCKLLNSNYNGPIMTLRASGGTGASSNFYSDRFGNITTALGSGTTLESWLTAQGGNTSYAFISTLYDQSVTCSNNATQTTTGSQPIYDVTNQLINFGYTGTSGGVASPQTNSFLNLPNGTVPYGNSSYTVLFKHRNWTNYFGMAINGVLGSGDSTQISNACNNFGFSYFSGYTNYFYTSGIQYGAINTNKAGNVMSFRYSNAEASLKMYTNSSPTWSLGSFPARAGTNATNTIGKTSYNEYFNGQMYYLYIFGTSLSDADRNLVEITLT